MTDPCFEPASVFYSESKQYSAREAVNVLERVVWISCRIRVSSLPTSVLVNPTLILKQVDPHS